MTRVERSEEVARRRGRGESVRFIAEALGLSRQYVQELLNDPDGSRARRRKARYRRPCPGYEGPCGRLMDGSHGRSDRGSKLCRECSKRRQRAVRMRWTRESVVDAIRVWAAEHGRPPVAKDWIRSGPGHPSFSMVYGPGHPFGSWADAVEAAGFPRPVRSVQRSYPHHAARVRALALVEPVLTPGRVREACPGIAVSYSEKILQDLAGCGLLVRERRGVYRRAA